jgi:hypothetical protein
MIGAGGSMLSAKCSVICSLKITAKTPNQSLRGFSAAEVKRLVWCIRMDQQCCAASSSGLQVRHAQHEYVKSLSNASYQGNVDFFKRAPYLE